MKLLWMIIAAASLSFGCVPQFNHPAGQSGSEPAVSEPAAPVAPVNPGTAHPPVQSVFDPNVSGGVAQSASTSFKVLGGSSKPVSGAVATSASFSVRGAIAGQAAP